VNPEVVEVFFRPPVMLISDVLKAEPEPQISVQGLVTEVSINFFL